MTGLCNVRTFFRLNTKKQKLQCLQVPYRRHPGSVQSQSPREWLFSMVKSISVHLATGSLSQETTNLLERMELSKNTSKTSNKPATGVLKTASLPLSETRRKQVPELLLLRARKDTKWNSRRGKWGRRRKLKRSRDMGKRSS